MSTLTQIVADVVAETRRPDLQTRIERAVRNAVLRLHQSEMFSADLSEGRVGSAAYTSVAPDSRYVIPKTALARFRALNKFYAYDATTGIVGKEFSIEDNPNFSLNQFGTKRTGIVRAMGDSLIVLGGDIVGSSRSFYASWYTNPDVTSLSTETWLTKDYPYAVMWAAVAAIYRGNGKAEEANAAQAEAMTEYNNILTNSITLQGR